MTRKMMKKDKQFSAKLRMVRKAKGLTMAEVSERVGVTQQQYQKYESAGNRVSIGKLYLIAEALSVPVATILPETKEISEPLFKGKLDTHGLHNWIRLSDEEKDIVVNIMRQLNKGKSNA